MMKFRSSLTRRETLSTLGAASAVGLAGCTGGSDDVTTWRLETSTEGTAIYQMSQGMAAIIDEHSDRLSLDARPTEGSKAAMVKMDNGEIDLAYASDLFAYQAKENLESFENFDSDLNYIWRCYDVILNFNAFADSGIENVTDLEGTDVTLGVVNGNPDVMLRKHLSHAVDLDDVNFVPMGYDQIDSALGEGRVDAAHDLRLSARYSSLWNQVYITNDNVALLEWPDEAIQSIQDDPEINGQRRSLEELADIYNHDVSEMENGWMGREELYWAETVFHIIGNQNTDEDLAEHFVSVLLNNLEELKGYHNLAEVWTPTFCGERTDLVDGIDLNPGARQAFEDAGADI